MTLILAAFVFGCALTIGNFGYQYAWGAGDYGLALERSYFQMIALLAFAGLLAWGPDKEEAA